MLKNYSEDKGEIGIFAALIAVCSRNQISSGELSEWLKEHAWKVCILERVSRVRISYSPQVFICTRSFATGFLFGAAGRACSIRMRRIKNEGSRKAASEGSNCVAGRSSAGRLKVQ
jgi:hypothetical protein